MHVTLGVYLKMFKMFEACCLDIDIEIAAIYVKNTTVPDEDFGQYVYKMKELHYLQHGDLRFRKFGTHHARAWISNNQHISNFTLFCIYFAPEK